MVSEAIQAIQNEIDSEKDNPCIKVIGEFLIEYIRRHPAVAGAIYNSGKYLTGAYKAIEDYARKKPRHGNCVAVAPDEAFEQVLKFYGIEHTDNGPVFQSRFLQDAPVTPNAAVEERSSFTLDLADLL